MRSLHLLLLAAFMYGCSDAPATGPNTTTPSGEATSVTLTELTGNSMLDARIVRIQTDSNRKTEIVKGLLLAQPRNGRMVWSNHADTSLNVSAIDGSNRTILRKPYAYRLGEFAALSLDGSRVAWVNSPALNKMDDPLYTPLTRDETPAIITADGARINVIAGSVDGTTVTGLNMIVFDAGRRVGDGT